MQILFKKSVLLSLMLSIGNPIKAFDISDIVSHPRRHWQLITSTAAATSALVAVTVGYLFRGKNYSAETIKQERLLLAEKSKLEDEKDRERAFRFYLTVNKKHEKELKAIKEKGAVTLEVFEQVIPFSRFGHSDYNEQLQKEWHYLAENYMLLPESKQNKTKKLIEDLKTIQQSHAKLRKDDIQDELEKKTVVEREKQLFETQLAAKKQKLEAKEVKTKSIQEMATESKNAITALSERSDQLLTTHQNQALASNLLQLAQKAEFDRHISSEISAIRALSKKVGNVEKTMITKEQMKTLTEELQKLQSKVDKIEENQGHQESALVNLTADIKTIATAPSAPPYQ
jgi:hypothetical protein